ARYEVRSLKGLHRSASQNTLRGSMNRTFENFDATPLRTVFASSLLDSTRSRSTAQISGSRLNRPARKVQSGIGTRNAGRGPIRTALPTRALIAANRRSVLFFRRTANGI